MGGPKWSRPENVELSLRAVEAMAKRYSSHPSLLGIELLNEPSQRYSECNHTLLHQYYVDSYHIIRQYSDSALVVFNELYVHLFNKWNDALLEPHFYNVVLDWHLYQFMYDSWSVYQHVALTKDWQTLIDTYKDRHPLLVGEWSMGTGATHQAGQPYVDACVNAFESTSGWYMWNWKIQPGIGFEEWDVQRQYEKGVHAGGLDPLRMVNIENKRREKAQQQKLLF